MATVLPIIAAGSSVFAAGAVFYRIIRPKFGVTVNCWFCDKNTRVPYGNQNCWDCPHCDQYNGFKQDGGYNKPIPSQHFEEFNYPITAECRSPQEFNSGSAVLCERCSRNQLLKVKQLANFQPYDERNYDFEVEAYKQQLEDVYKLCWSCDRKVNKIIHKQNATLCNKLRDSLPPRHMLNSDLNLSNLSNTSTCSEHMLCRLSCPWHVHVLRTLATICSVALLLSSLQNLLEHSGAAASPQQSLPYIVYSYLVALYQTAGTIVCVGLVTNMLAVYISGKESLSGSDVLCCCSWLAAILLFSPMCTVLLEAEDNYVLQAFVSVTCFILSLWSMAFPRYYKRSKRRISLIKKRQNHNTSGVSSTTGDFSTENTPNATPVPSMAGDTEPQSVQQDTTNTDLDRLETLSIGSHRKCKSPPGGVFAQYNMVSSTSGSQNNTSSMGSMNLNNLRYRRPLISPARFKPSQSKSQLFQPAATGLPSTGLTSLSSAKNLFSSNSSQADDDQRSVFSEHRSQSAVTDSHMTNDTSSRSSVSDSVCPVDTTVLENNTFKQGGYPRQKRSILSQCVWGVSIGLNLTLLLYFFVDFNKLREYIISST